MGTKAKLPYGKRYQKFFQPKRGWSFVRCLGNGFHAKDLIFRSEYEKG